MEVMPKRVSAWVQRLQLKTTTEAVKLAYQDEEAADPKRVSAWVQRLQLKITTEAVKLRRLPNLPLPLSSREMMWGTPVSRPGQASRCHEPGHKITTCPLMECDL
ncbi:hypothetical protein EOD39_2231 [Acipenser ruthenus]|uniref:Uncharacterized protein n=1 Tax=Acipenser ruthenus TaxID=7906 RepID=A0A444U323_ACIRT|nr:hypothetical protein EOD39_2231 [Acipenser ruthenus]